VRLEHFFLKVYLQRCMSGLLKQSITVIVTHFFFLLLFFIIA